MLVFAGANDGIAPIESVKAAVPLLSGSPDVRFEIVPGGHLGMLTGRKARTGTWPVIDAVGRRVDRAPGRAPGPRAVRDLTAYDDEGGAQDRRENTDGQVGRDPGPRREPDPSLRLRGLASAAPVSRSRSHRRKCPDGHAAVRPRGDGAHRRRTEVRRTP